MKSCRPQLSSSLEKAAVCPLHDPRSIWGKAACHGDERWVPHVVRGALPPVTRRDPSVSAHGRIVLRVSPVSRRHDFSKELHVAECSSFRAIFKCWVFRIGAHWIGVSLRGHCSCSSDENRADNWRRHQRDLGERGPRAHVCLNNIEKTQRKADYWIIQRGLRHSQRTQRTLASHQLVVCPLEERRSSISCYFVPGKPSWDRGVHVHVAR